MSIKILTDSTACLTKEFCERENIGIIESLLCINGEYKRDISDIQRSSFLRRPDKLAYNLFSAQADSSQVSAIIEDAISEGYEEIFYIGVSMTITNQFELVEFVSDLYRDRIGITLFQSGSMGASQGGMVLIANKMLKNGESVNKITKVLEKRRNEFKTYIISNSFKTIFKTGKIKSKKLISTIARFFGRFRVNKPIVEVNQEEGLIAVGKAKSKILALRKAIKMMYKALPHEKEYDLVLVESGTIKYFPKIKKKIEKKFKIKKVHYWEASPVVIWTIGKGSIKFSLIPHI